MSRKKYEIQLFASTLDEIALFFGVHRRTVSDWRKKGMPGTTGKFPLGAIAQWLIANVWGEPTDSLQAMSRKELEQEKLRVGNARSMLRLQKEAAALVDREAALAELEVDFNIVRDRLTKLPKELVVGQASGQSSGVAESAHRGLQE